MTQLDVINTMYNKTVFGECGSGFGFQIQAVMSHMLFIIRNIEVTWRVQYLAQVHALTTRGHQQGVITVKSGSATKT